MKVYDCPAAISYSPDYSAPYTEWIKAEEEHKAKLREWLHANGYTKKNTGRIVRFGVADGYAQYMIAEGAKTILIHLPYGDAYEYRDVSFLPKAEILRRADQHDAMTKLFRSK